MNESKSTSKIISNVRFSDTDKYAHVNNSKYFNYFEEARTEWIYGNKNLINWTKENSIQLVIAEQSCKYIHPITHPNKLEVTQIVKKVGVASIELYYEIRISGQNKIVTTANVKLASFNSITNKPQRIPKNIKETLL